MPQLRYLCCKAVIVVKTPEPCVPDFSFRPPCHTSSLLYEDCCRTSVCANHPTVRKGCSLLLLSRELIAAPRYPKPSPGRYPSLCRVLCPRTPAHNTRRHGHPLAGVSWSIGVGRCELPRILFRRNTNVV